MGVADREMDLRQGLDLGNAEGDGMKGRRNLMARQDAAADRVAGRAAHQAPMVRHHQMVITKASLRLAQAARLMMDHRRPTLLNHHPSGLSKKRFEYLSFDRFAFQRKKIERRE